MLRQHAASIWLIWKQSAFTRIPYKCLKFLEINITPLYHPLQYRNYFCSKILHSNNVMKEKNYNLQKRINKIEQELPKIHNIKTEETFFYRTKLSVTNFQFVNILRMFSLSLNKSCFKRLQVKIQPYSIVFPFVDLLVSINGFSCHSIQCLITKLPSL